MKTVVEDIVDQMTERQTMALLDCCLGQLDVETVGRILQSHYGPDDLDTLRDFLEA